VKLLVPYVGEVQPADARLIRLAEFLGIECELLSLAKSVKQWVGYVDSAISDRASCLVVNPRVLQEWTGADEMPADLALFFQAHFSHILLHSPRPDSFDSSVLTELSCGYLDGVQGIESSAQSYEILPDSKDVCEAFAGLSFGPVNPGSDRTFTISADTSALRQLISIAGRPFMAVMRREDTNLWFLGCEDIADLNEEVGNAPLSEYFSRLVPHAMALRSIFGEQCWRPSEQHACVIVDDPLLQQDYGFLNFESLLGLMTQHNFHTTIAFIPHNFKRSAPTITRMFKENGGRFALCFHGNDHTAAELASVDTTQLNTMLEVAENRMNVHERLTGVGCDRVMVFPQGNFSFEAMTVLKSRNFDAAVNTVPNPMHCDNRLTIGEIAQPALLRYGNFPLFLRKDSLHTQDVDIAFNCFFGRPVLIVEHHNIFRNPEPLVEAVKRVNLIAPKIRWSNVGDLVSKSTLRLRAPDGSYHVRAYSRSVQVSNDSGIVQRCLIEWKQSGQSSALDDQVLQDGKPCGSYTLGDGVIRVSVDLLPGNSREFSVVHQNTHEKMDTLGFRWNVKAFVRRRLSELRDNYFSKSSWVLAAAKALQRCLPH